MNGARSTNTERKVISYIAKQLAHVSTRWSSVECDKATEVFGGRRQKQHDLCEPVALLGAPPLVQTWPFDHKLPPCELCPRFDPILINLMKFAVR